MPHEHYRVAVQVLNGNITHEDGIAGSSLGDFGGAEHVGAQASIRVRYDNAD